jgi:hypothetical protein
MTAKKVVNEDKMSIVGLIIMIEVTLENGAKTLMAVLRKRGRGLALDMKPIEHPGCHEVTVSGEVHHHELFDDDFDKVVIEVLGFDFRVNIQEYYAKRLMEVERNDVTKETFAMLVPADLLRSIRLCHDYGELSYITKEQIKDIVPLTTEMRAHGPSDPHTVAMSRNGIEALKRAFHYFENK